MCALVAALFKPAKVPLTVSFDPASTAVAEPSPATVAFIAASIGTGASRVLNVSALCATPPSASNIPVNTMIPGFGTDASLNFIMITEFDLPNRQRGGLAQTSWRDY